METRQRFFNMVNEVVLINGWQYKKNAFRSVASANFLIFDWNTTTQVTYHFNLQGLNPKKSVLYVKKKVIFSLFFKLAMYQRVQRRLLESLFLDR